MAQVLQNSRCLRDVLAFLNFERWQCEGSILAAELFEQSIVDDFVVQFVLVRLAGHENEVHVVVARLSRCEKSLQTNDLGCSAYHFNFYKIEAD